MYMSIYLRPITNGRAKFMFFNTEITSDHIKNGYWQFNVEGKDEDDLKAHSQGFMCPEALLDAAASGQEYPSDISLKWIPGEDDTYKAIRVGTVQEHMRCIAEERMIFGLPASFQNETPTYPADKTGKLFKHRKDNNTPSMQDGRVIARYTKQQADAKHQSSLQSAIARRVAGSTNSASPLLVANTRSSMAAKASQKRRNPKSSGAGSSKVPNPPSQLKTPSLTNSLGIPPLQNMSGNNAADKSPFTLPGPKTTNSKQPIADDPDDPHDWSHYRHLYLPHLYAPPAASPAPENSNKSLKQRRNVPRTLAMNGNTMGRQHEQQDRSKNRNDLAGSAAYPINLEKDLETIGSPFPFERSSARDPVLYSPQKHSTTPINDFQGPATTSKNNAASTVQMADGHKLMSQSPQPTKGLIQRSSQTSLQRAAPEQTPSKVSVAPQINVELPTSSEQPQERTSQPKSPLKQHDAVKEPTTLPSMSPALQSITREITSLSLSSKVSAWLDVTTDTNQDEMLSPMAMSDHLSVEPAVTKESASAPASQTSKISKIPNISPQKTPQKTSVATPKTQSLSLSDTPTEPAKQPEQSVTANTGPVVNLETDFGDLNAFMDRVLPLSEDVPCFDCGGTAFHTYDCHIGHIEPMNPTTSQTLALARTIEDGVIGTLQKQKSPEEEQEECFPEPPEPEPLADTIAGMAEIVRKDKSYKKDPDLHGLPDQQMLLTWGLKSIGGRVVYPDGEISSTMFDHEWPSDGEAEKEEEKEEDVDESPEAEDARWKAFQEENGFTDGGDLSWLFK